MGAIGEDDDRMQHLSPYELHRMRTGQLAHSNSGRLRNRGRDRAPAAVEVSNARHAAREGGSSHKVERFYPDHPERSHLVHQQPNRLERQHHEHNDETASVASTCASQVAHPDVDLYEAMGGQEGCKLILDIFFSRVFSDWRLAKFFSGVSPHKIRQKQIVILSYIIKGPDKFKGRELHTYHTRLIQDLGLRPRHLELFIEHFRGAMEMAQIPQDATALCIERMHSASPLIFGEEFADQY